MNGAKKKRIAGAAGAAVLGAGAMALGLAWTRPGTGVANAAEARAPVTTNAGQKATTFPASNAGGAAAVAQSIAQFQRNGTFTGTREYAYYGFVRVQAVVENGSLKNVKVTEYPNDNGRSHYINSVALPYLIQEAVDAQSYRVDFISGATFTSTAFIKSLRSALTQSGQPAQAPQTGSTQQSNI